MSQVIVVGGGLSGMSAAHTVLQHGGRVVLLDKSPFCGGNSTKATSGINAAGTSTQRKLDIHDTPEVFEQDTITSAAAGARPKLIHALTHESAPAVEWLMESFGLDLSVIARLAAHSNPRTHRGKERFPGMTITYALMEKLDEIAATGDGRARVENKAKVTELIRDSQGTVIGCKYEKKGETHEEYGPVVIATGGFGADFSENSLLAKVSGEFAKMSAWQADSRAGKQNGGKNIKMPNLLNLPTTNGPHCTGDGIKLAVDAGADTYDLHCVQVHPTGLIDPTEPDAKVKFLAAEALRGSGGIILDKEGRRFADELGKRDYVSGRMFFHDKPPYRLILNQKSIDKIKWHIEHYEARGLMKQMTGQELAKELGVPVSRLEETFKEYNEAAENPSGPANKWEKKFFESTPIKVNDNFAVAIITPVVHYCMGGVAGNEHAEVLTQSAQPIPGLYVAGEALGGVHGTNRLGGSSLLDCVVYGRIAGRTSTRYLLENLIKSGNTGAAPGTVNMGGITASVNVVPNTNRVSVDFSWGDAANQHRQIAASPTSAQAGAQSQSQQQQGKGEEAAAAAASGGGAKKEMKTYTMDEVAKHTTKDDCWVALHGEVYQLENFLDEHPGGAKAILLYAGKDATEAFDMLHPDDVLERYAQDFKIGKVAEGAKAKL